MTPHPYRALWDERDVRRWVDSLSDDVTMYSPMFSKPFRGRDTAAELFEILLLVLHDFEVTDELSGDETHAFFWRARADGKIVEGADLIRHDASGKVAEIRVLIRPLTGIASFAAVAGPPLAARRGRATGWFGSVISKPLGVFLRIVNAVGTRLVNPSE